MSGISTVACHASPALFGSASLEPLHQFHCLSLYLKFKVDIYEGGPKKFGFLGTAGTPSELKKQSGIHKYKLHTALV